ncbi:MAG: histidine--tRNA ligase [Elusimicrobia bacterium]|nr:histidine--tRNA ligase [Elusimicrobiota bacterium]
MTYQTIRGFRDILPPQSDAFSFIEKISREIFTLYGYREIRIPAVEYFELFIKSTGETTDIVQKEMYRFKDASGRDLALRPEGTPGVARAYINNNLSQTGLNGKYFYIADMFRAERPQAGRYRQFEQIGAENIGASSPYSDAESAAMLAEIFKRLGAENLRLEINSLGCPSCRPKYREKLISYLSSQKDLCSSCLQRLEKNPLRVLDCKIDGPKLTDFPSIELCGDCAVHHEKFKKCLSLSKVDFFENPKLVRGLDYYQRTVFELKTSSLGAQDAVAGGGRYDGLIKDMGGPASPAVGWALGADRAAMIIEKRWGEFEKKSNVFLVSADKERGDYCFSLAQFLRSENISCDFSDFSLSFKSQMRSADKSGALFAAIAGEDEEKNGEVSLKNLFSKEQKKVKKEELTEIIKRSL